MKRLLSIAIAVIAVMAMAVPAMAADVSTNVTVGTNSTAPYMIASTMTPDTGMVASDGVQVDLEFAKPVAGSFAPVTDLLPASDGWKMVKFYVEVGHVNGVANINNVAIDVKYPASFSSEDNALFADRAGKLKFEINAGRDTTSTTGWSAQIVYPFPEFYPVTSSGGPTTAAVLPALSVRELVYNSTTDPTRDMVDVNCDDVLGNDSDKNWNEFLPFWTDARVNYAPDYNAAEAFDKFQLGQAIVLEIRGWMWYHQPGVKYTVEAKAATEGGATSAVLNDGVKFLFYNRVIGLFIDFSNVQYLGVTVGSISWAEGDRFLSTPGLTTVWNNGNTSAQVLVEATKMVKDYTGNLANIKSNIYYNSLAKTIEHFDAKLYYTNGAGSVIQLGSIDYLADASATVITVDNTTPGAGEIGLPGAVLLQACRPAKIEFSVHPELLEMQESGNYKGFLTLSVASYTGTQLPTP